MQGGRRVVDDRFHVIDFQVHDKLIKVSWSLLAFYGVILRNAIIQEDWETESEWAVGRFNATTAQLIKWTDMSRGYVQKLRIKLIDAGLMVRAADGSYTLPMYKRKADEEILAKLQQWI